MGDPAIGGPMFHPRSVWNRGRPGLIRRDNMFIGKVTGSVVASQKVKSVTGRKLLLVQAMNVKGDAPGALETTGRTAVAIDTVGAGEGELVLVTQGSSARLTESTGNVPTDAVIIGIIDAIQMRDQEIYKKQG
jgi:ethanolamine utilization protein EutN